MTLDPKALEAAYKAADTTPEHLRTATVHAVLQAYLDNADLVPRGQHFTDDMNDMVSLGMENERLTRQRDKAHREAKHAVELVAQSAEDRLTAGRERVVLRREAETQGRQLAALREALGRTIFSLEDIAATSGTVYGGAIKQARAALTDTAEAVAQWVRVPEGYVVVPVEPTDAMAEAWAALALDRIKRRMKDDNDCKGATEGARESYKAMLAAAPKAGEGPEGK